MSGPFFCNEKLIKNSYPRYSLVSFIIGRGKEMVVKDKFNFWAQQSYTPTIPVAMKA
jgi:hypothetical protein